MTKSKNKSNSSSELQGVVVPIITPTDKNEWVDEPALRKLVQYLLAAGVNGLFVGGSAGEGSLLADNQWRRLMEIVFDEAAGKVFLLAGTNDTSFQRVKERIQVVKNIGYKNFVVTATYYLATQTQDEHLRFFGACKEFAADMEMIVYNIPQNIKAEIAVETLIEMAERKWVHYCKESSGKLEYFKRLVREGKQAGLKVFEGDEATMADGLEAGAVGIVPVCANYKPNVFVDIYNLAMKKDYAAVRDKHQEVLQLRSKLVTSGPFWLTGIKYAVSLLGMGSGSPVLPLAKITAQQKKEITEFVKS